MRQRSAEQHWKLRKHIRLLTTFQADRAAASATAKGTHSFFTIVVPTTRSTEGMMTPVIFSVEKSPLDSMKQLCQHRKVGNSVHSVVNHHWQKENIPHLD